MDPSCSLSYKFIDLEQQNITNKEGDIFDPILSYNHMYQLKNDTFKFFKEGHDQLNLWESNLSPIVFPKVFHFSEMVSLCIQNYSSHIRVILSKDSSKVLCLVMTKSGTQMLVLSESDLQECQPFNEQALISKFHSFNQTSTKLK